ncbi:MAG TPA: hypothetical protein EYG68_09705 [Leucothrix mucor]|nr:hypothetical protein [Leucothrix mucor]
MDKHTGTPLPAKLMPDVEILKESFNTHLFCYEVENKRVFVEPKIKMEVLEKTVIYPIPNAPKWYAGVTSLRGTILPVVNMHFLLGLKDSSTNKRLLQLEHPNFPPLAIAIDNLPHQRNIENLKGENKPNHSDYPQWISSSAKHNNCTFLFADHSALFQAMQNSSNEQPLITTLSLPTEE